MLTSMMKKMGLSRSNSRESMTMDDSGHGSVARSTSHSTDGTPAPEIHNPKDISAFLTDQRTVYGTDIFEDLTVDDRAELDRLTRTGYLYDEAALVIFNRKRNLDVPAVGHVSFTVVQPSRKEIKRKYKKFLSGLDEDNRLRLSLALSEQQVRYGANMLDVMKDDDLPEIKAVMRKRNCDFCIAMSKVYNAQHKRRNSASRSPSPSTTASRNHGSGNIGFSSFFRSSRSRSASPARSSVDLTSSPSAAPLTEGIAGIDHTMTSIPEEAEVQTFTSGGGGIAFQGEESVAKGNKVAEVDEVEEVRVLPWHESFYEIPQAVPAAAAGPAMHYHQQPPRRQSSFAAGAPLPPQQQPQSHQSMYHPAPVSHQQQPQHVMRRVYNAGPAEMSAPYSGQGYGQGYAAEGSMMPPQAPYQQQPPQMMVYPDGMIAYPQQQYQPPQQYQPQYQGQYQQASPYPPQYQQQHQQQQAGGYYLYPVAAPMNGEYTLPPQQQYRTVPHTRSLPNMPRPRPNSYF